MMLPILRSLSVAPGSYFFSACAVPAMAVASSPASTVVMAWLKTRWRIIVLPDVLAEAQPPLSRGSSLSRRAECTLSMHDRCEVASDGLAAIFRRTEGALSGSALREREQGLSNAVRAKRA